jgi:hypothetical protein
MNTLAIMHALSTGPSGSWVVPVRTVSEANSHEHWRMRARRAKEQRLAACTWTRASTNVLEKPRVIRFTRLAPGLLDDDNLQGACKSVRDGVADAFATKDGPDCGITFMYAQERGPAKQYAVRCEVWL